MKTAILTILSVSTFALASPAMAQYERGGYADYDGYGEYSDDYYQPGIVGGDYPGGYPGGSAGGNTQNPSTGGDTPADIDKSNLDGLINSINPDLEEVERARISRLPNGRKKDQELERLEQRLQQNTNSVTRSHGIHSELTTIR